MATLDFLKGALQKTASESALSCHHPLTDEEYATGFKILREAESATYDEFIVPQLNIILDTCFPSEHDLSILEIGPGPESVLERLPMRFRERIRKYAAFEPNGIFATSMEESLRPAEKEGSWLPSLKEPPKISRDAFTPDDQNPGDGTCRTREKYDFIIFCHSMYKMKPAKKFIERALQLLVDSPSMGIVAVFHRDGTLRLDGLACCNSVAFSTGNIRVPDDDESLDCFAPLIAGFTDQDKVRDHTLRAEWRDICRTNSRRENEHPKYLVFSSPNIMITFNRTATALSELVAQIPVTSESPTIKNWEARSNRTAAIVRPTELLHIQECVRWAQKHGFALTVLGGGHSSNCLRSNVVAIDMSAFDQIHCDSGTFDSKDDVPMSEHVIVVGAGCKTSDIIRKTEALGITVPLGARPSVGAGLWLQGGIGHLARLHGLSCDAIIGAVLVSLESCEIWHIGCVPSQHRPANSVRPERESDLLWALKGAGTNFGVVVSVTFQTYPASTFRVRNWIFQMDDENEAAARIHEFNTFAASLRRNLSADAYLYFDKGQAHLGVTVFETSNSQNGGSSLTTEYIPTGWKLPSKACIVNSTELFDADMYMTEMHGGHGGGKTSSFKRCLFFKDVDQAQIFNHFLRALKDRPSPLCYLHLLHGGGRVSEIAPEASAFGCRAWDFACVITAVWPRDQISNGIALSSLTWVYDLAMKLLPFSCGAYSADLGSDLRDKDLASKAFGANTSRLVQLKRTFDPYNILRYACPLIETTKKAPKLIILVTGESGAGKDYCAAIWASVFNSHHSTARFASISDVTKQQYAAYVGADLTRLLQDRAYKEQHRPELTRFFQGQMLKNPHLPAEHFEFVVEGSGDVEVLLITGMRDEAPVAAFGHLVPGSQLLEVRIEAEARTRGGRIGANNIDSQAIDHGIHHDNVPQARPRSYSPDLIFKNECLGDVEAIRFAQVNLLGFVHSDLRRLADMIPLTPDFPNEGIAFRDVLGLTRQPGGLRLCNSLLRVRGARDWSRVNAIVSCEVGGIPFASVLASELNIPLALIRKAGKRPPPTVSIYKHPSYISSMANSEEQKTIFELDEGILPIDSQIVFIDDVLSTGRTLCAVLGLLHKAGCHVDNISVMVIAEFPVHRGRKLLHDHGYGAVSVQSLLTFDGR